MTIDAVHTYEEIQQLRRPTNFYGKEELQKAVKDPAIIHYTTNMLVIRPWFSNTDHPFADVFKKYMGMSTWKNRELKEMLRHSVAMSMYKNGIPISYVKDFLGHSDISTTSIYAYADNEDIKKALEAVQEIIPSSSIGKKKWKGKEKDLIKYCGLG